MTGDVTPVIAVCRLLLLEKGRVAVEGSAAVEDVCDVSDVDAAVEALDREDCSRVKGEPLLLLLDAALELEESDDWLEKGAGSDVEGSADSDEELGMVMVEDELLAL